MNNNICYAGIRSAYYSNNLYAEIRRDNRSDGCRIKTYIDITPSSATRVFWMIMKLKEMKNEN